ncbi:MAG: hypothetical protein LW628_09460 [Fimbriimonadaceae bacterium]|nr:hypothetical protein [Fimbriimonadaceae bacterium]
MKNCDMIEETWLSERELISLIEEKSTTTVRLLGIDYKNLKAAECRIPGGRVIDLDCSNHFVIGPDLIAVTEQYIKSILGIYSAGDSLFLPVFDE